MQLEHTTEIQAPVDAVWALTVAVEDWPRITPTTMTSVERLDSDPLRVGSQARIKQARQRPAVWTVERCDAPNAFEWSTTVMGMTMRARHRTEPTATGCRNTLGVEITGGLSGIFGRLVGSSIAKTIATENECFKREAESLRA